MRVLKEVIWVGSSLNDLKTFSSEVKDEIGFSLYLVQIRQRLKIAKTIAAKIGG